MKEIVFRISDDQQYFQVVSSDEMAYRQIEYTFTKEDEKAKYKKTKQNQSGKVPFFKKGRINIGLQKDLKKCCEDFEINLIIENKENFPILNLDKDEFNNYILEFFKNHKDKFGNPLKPHDHQLEECYKVLRNRYCTTEVATSGGKTLMLSILIFYVLGNLNPDAKFLIIVPSTTLVSQTYDEIYNFNLGFNFENLTPHNIRISEIMGDNNTKREANNPNVYIGTFQSLCNYPPKFFNQFYMVVVDEAHKTKAKTIQDILKNCDKAQYRIGLSGTYFKQGTLDDFSIKQWLGPNVGKIKAEELMKKGIVTDVIIKSLILNHNDDDFYKLIQGLIQSGKGKEAYQLEVSYIQNNDKRLNFIIDLLKKVKTNTLVLFNTIDHGKKVFEKAKETLLDKDLMYIDGEVSSAKREVIKKQMELSDGNVKILVASFGTLSTGVSINNLHNIIFIDSYKSEIIIRQSIGRGLRLHESKQKATIIDIVDVFIDTHYNKGSLFRQYKERCRIYNEQNFQYKEYKIDL